METPADNAEESKEVETTDDAASADDAETESEE